MCRATTCKKCGRTTWAGCGAHVEQVLGSVPKADRCHCREDASAAKAARVDAGAAPAKRSWFRR